MGQLTKTQLDSYIANALELRFSGTNPLKYFHLL